MKQINIQFKTNENRYISIYKQIKEMIILGKIKKGEGLPSRRSLASYLNVSTNTILNAYNLLLDEGYIESKEKSGYYVSNRNYKQNIKAHNVVSNTPKYKYDFTTTNIDKTLFPYYTFKKVANNIISNNPEVWLTRSPYQGNIHLRQVLASYLYENKGMNVTKDNIIIVSSLEESLEIISSLIPVKVLGIENPTYLKVYSFFKDYVKTILFDIGDKGIILDNKENVDLMYVTPYNQFPTGVKMSSSTKHELLNYPTNYILEDDFDCDLINHNKVMSTLYSLNNTKVFYHGSFSHTLCGGLRISYLVIPNNLINKYKNKYDHSSSRISSFDQELLASFIEEGHYYRHLTKFKKEISKKKEIIKNALKSVKNITFIENELSFIISYQGDINSLKERLNKNEIKVNYLNDNLVNKESSSILISVLGISLKDLENAINELIDVLK